MAVSKVIYGGNTLVDLTADTVSADAVLSGVTAHDASGAVVTGTMAQPVSGSLNLSGVSSGSISDLGFTPSNIMLVYTSLTDSTSSKIRSAYSSNDTLKCMCYGGSRSGLSISTVNGTVSFSNGNVSFSAVHYAFASGTWEYVVW